MSTNFKWAIGAIVIILALCVVGTIFNHREAFTPRPIAIDEIYSGTEESTKKIALSPADDSIYALVSSALFKKGVTQQWVINRADRACDSIYKLVEYIHPDDYQQSGPIADELCQKYDKELARWLGVSAQDFGLFFLVYKSKFN